MREQLLRAAVLALAVAGAGVYPAQAQEFGLEALGVRGGVSVNPDQFQFGVHVRAGTFTRNVRFQPSFEFGLGNGVRLGAANIDALYTFKPQRSFQPYAGGGLGINFIDVTEGVGAGTGMDVQAVLNLVGGIEFGARSRAPHRYLLELRVGVGDTPDLKVTAGITF